MAYVLIFAFIIGLFMYLLSSNSKAQDLGRLIVLSSLLAFFIAVAPLTVRLLGR